MYDFAHGQSDYFEGVTHSICTLEFVVHRPLYEYFVKELADESYLVSSKRRLQVPPNFSATPKSIHMALAWPI